MLPLINFTFVHFHICTFTSVHFYFCTFLPTSRGIRPILRFAGFAYSQCLRQVRLGTGLSRHLWRSLLPRLSESNIGPREGLADYEYLALSNRNHTILTESHFPPPISTLIQTTWSFSPFVEILSISRFI